MGSCLLQGHSHMVIEKGSALLEVLCSVDMNDKPTSSSFTVSAWLCALIMESASHGSKAFPWTSAILVWYFACSALLDEPFLDKVLDLGLVHLSGWKKSLITIWRKAEEFSQYCRWYIFLEHMPLCADWLWYLSAKRCLHFKTIYWNTLEDES